MPSKSKNQRYHARCRALTRYGIEFTSAKQKEAITQIQTGRATLYEKQSNRVSLFWVVIDNIKLKVVYDRTRKTIASVLPEEDRL